MFNLQINNDLEFYLLLREIEGIDNQMLLDLHINIEEHLLGNEFNQVQRNYLLKFKKAIK